MVKFYLSESSSVFEINVPSKLIGASLKDYRDLTTLLNASNVKVTQLPRSTKDNIVRYFPNIDLSQEEAMKPLIENLCKPNIFSDLQIEVYKNLLDSYHRFTSSRKWKDHIRSFKTNA